MNINIAGGYGRLSKLNPCLKLNIDTFKARNSVVPTTAESVYENAEQGRKAVYDTIARFAEEGRLLTNNTGDGGEVLSRIFAARVTEEKQFELAFIPKYPAVISWENV